MSEADATKPKAFYKEDTSYDPRFYVNPWYNYFVIYGIVLTLWVIGAIVWWGMFSFGIYSAVWMDAFNLIFWGCTLLYIAFLLFVGSQANTIKREHLFW